MASAILFPRNPFLFSSTARYSSVTTKARNHNSKPNKSHHSSCICQLASSPSPWSSTPNTILHLLNYAIHPLPANFTPDDLLNALRSEQDLPKALRLLQWATKQDSYIPNPSIYEYMIQRLGFAGHFELMREVFSLMSPPTEHVFFIMIKSYANHHMVDEALAVLKEMKVTALQPTTECYNFLLNFFIDTNKPKIVESLYYQMRFAGIQPDVKTFTILIKALCRANRMDSALGLLKQMPSDHGLVPNQITYNTLIYGFSVRGRMEEASEILKQMESNGCIPDRKTYNVLLRGYCMQGRVEEACRFLEEICGSGFCPDTVTFSSIVNGFCKAGEVDNAAELLANMLEWGLKPNVVTYTTLISGLCKVGKLKEATRIFNEMVVRDSAPNAVTYKTMMHAMIREGRVEEAIELFKKPSSKGHDSDA